MGNGRKSFARLSRFWPLKKWVEGWESDGMLVKPVRKGTFSN